MVKDYLISLGEIGDKFYILLEGTVSVLIPKMKID
jgi:CRP-like cAMP-binding protein